MFRILPACALLLLLSHTTDAGQVKPDKPEASSSQGVTAPDNSHPKSQQADSRSHKTNPKKVKHTKSDDPDYSPEEFVDSSSGEDDDSSYESPLPKKTQKKVKQLTIHQKKVKKADDDDSDYSPDKFGDVSSDEDEYSSDDSLTEKKPVRHRKPTRARKPVIKTLVYTPHKNNTDDSPDTVEESSSDEEGAAYDAPPESQQSEVSFSQDPIYVSQSQIDAPGFSPDDSDDSEDYEYIYNIVESPYQSPVPSPSQSGYEIQLPEDEADEESENELSDPGRASSVEGDYSDSETPSQSLLVSAPAVKKIRKQLKKPKIKAPKVKAPKVKAPKVKAPKAKKSKNDKTKTGTQKSDTDYSRDKFGVGWTTGVGDGLNTRHSMLMDYSTSTVFTGNNPSTINRGRWVDPYTGRIFYDAHELDIDHIVPLKWSWDHGAVQWSKQKRVTFANDFRNLVIVDSAMNRQKGSKGPTEWLPSEASYQRQYIARFVRVVKIYSLTFSPEELLLIAKVRRKIGKN